jgi:predicted acylesterase/phospholipase RssA
MRGLVYNLAPEQVAWSTVSGVSAGSINSFYAATYAKGDEKAMVEGSLNIMMNMSTDKIYKPWPKGLEDGLLNQHGLVDDSPLLEFITGIHKDRPLKRKLNVGATDANLGTFIPFDEKID